MEFPREELLEKYIRIYEQYVAPYEPDFEVAGGTTRYVRFNDAWYGLDPFDKLLITRLTNRKNTFPKAPMAKLKSNADPANYVMLRYDKEGNLKMAYYEKDGDINFAFVYVSKQLTIGYSLEAAAGGVTHSLYDFEWCEYDDAGRLISVEKFRGSGSAKDDVIINSEYYEYEGDNLSHAWQFKDFEKYPPYTTNSLVMNLMPDRLFNPDRFEYTFQRVDDGFDFTCSHYYRKSQTITHKDHIAQATLSHLAENGIRLI